MYNEDLKRQFIQECIKSEQQARRIEYMFDVAAKFETKWDADICTKSESELGEVMEMLTGVRSRSQASHLSTMRRYAKWCLKNNVPGACEGLINFQEVGLGKIKTNMFGNPEQLQILFDRSFAPIHDGRYDNVYRGFFWMAFAGLKESDTVKITSKHVDFKKMTINYDGRNYPIYEEALPVIRSLCLSGFFVFDFGNSDKIMKRVDGEQILRGARTQAEPKADSIRRLAVRRMNMSKPDDEASKLTYKDVWLSGIFYRAYEMEKVNGKYDLSEYLDDYYKSREDISDRRKLYIKNEIATDYLRWKSVFYK